MGLFGFVCSEKVWVGLLRMGKVWFVENGFRMFRIGLVWFVDNGFSMIRIGLVWFIENGFCL